MSALEAEYEDVFAGRPDTLSARATALQTAADAIGRATRSLRALVDGQTSSATDAISETAEGTATALERAE